MRFVMRKGSAFEHSCKALPAFRGIDGFEAFGKRANRCGPTQSQDLPTLQK